MQTALISTLLFVSTALSATELPKVLLYGNIVQREVEDVLQTENRNNEDLLVTDVMVTVHNEDGALILEYTNRPTGFYSIILDGGQNYVITFSKDGFIQKKLEVRTDNFEPLEKRKSFRMATDITLFARPDKGNFSAFERQPVARCSYDTERERLEWDMSYALTAFNQFVEAARRYGQQTALND